MRLLSSRAAIAARARIRRELRAIPPEARLRPLWLGLSVAGLIVLARLYLVGDLGWVAGSDLRAYWGLDPASPYQSAVGTAGAFLYSPVAALAVQPLHALPFEVVRVLWWCAGFACLAWLTGRWALAWLLFLPVAGDLYTGNIHLLLAAAIVLGMRRPAAWSVLLLTKVTPGIGLIWFAVRREWRSLAWAVGSAAGLAAVSLLVVPSWWRSWIDVLVSSTSGPPDSSPVLLGIPLWIRLIAAAAVVAWGAGRDRAWTVPVGAVVALPAVWVISPAMLVAAVPLLARSRPVPAADRTTLPGHAGAEPDAARRVDAVRRSFVQRVRAGWSG